MKLYRAQIDGGKKSLKLTARRPPASNGEFTYEQASADVIKVSGTLDGKQITATLRKMDQGQFNLTSRGFHWINEFPNNR